MRTWIALGLLLSSSAVGAGPASRWKSDSLFQLRASFTDAAGNKVSLESLAGHPVLLSMAYTSCQASCPLTLSRMKAIEAKLDEKTRANVRLVVVSFDPARDTPARLAEVAKERGLAAPRWSLLTGGDDDVRELAAALGFKFEPVEGGEFIHSNQITVLGPDGVVRAQLEGDAAETRTAVDALRRP